MPVLSCLPTAVYFLIFAGSVTEPANSGLPNSDTACLLFKCCYGQWLVLTAIQTKTNAEASDLIAF